MLPRRRRLRKSVTPESAGALLPSVFRSLRVEELARGFRAQQAFERAAGDRLCQRARAEKLRGKTLFVRVASAAWSHQLHALKAELLDLRNSGDTAGGKGRVVGYASFAFWERERAAYGDEEWTSDEDDPDDAESDDSWRQLLDTLDQPELSW